MANRSNIMGLHGLKNKTNKNSFDLSHRNLFTAKVGELIPCSVFELNPGDTINLDTSYFTRTAPLDSAAYTRLRENVQFFFVPYSQLWKYFDSQVLNMTSTPNGADVSRVATGLTSNSKITTQMPFVQYKALHEELTSLANAAIDSLNSHNYVKDNLFNNGEYRWSCSAKLLQLLGYGNFPEQNFSVSRGKSKYVLDSLGILGDNQPTNAYNLNLSIFRLLAYHKVCNDHYTYRQWQPYNAYLCNVDYLVPDKSNSLDISSLLPWKNNLSGKDNLTLLDMRFSNLPLDYFNGVLPTPQFGTESVVNLNLGSASGNATLSGTSDQPSYVDGSSAVKFPDHTLIDGDYTPQSSEGYFRKDNYAVTINSPHTHNFNGFAKIDTSLSGSLSIAALRQATALQKYKEIQLANDSDFVSQIEAHFGVRPSKSDTVSYFLGGSSSMIDINPQVNSNLADWSQSNALKAVPTGQGSSKIKFTADTYGIVLGIYRCVPVLDYAHLGVDRTLLKTDASDFVIPELDSIGMQQSILGEIMMPSYHDGSGISSKYSHLPTDSFGYAPRYAEYKTSFDRYNGEFCYSLSSWVTGLNLARLHDLIYSTSTSDLPHKLAPELFNCRPDLVSSIFLNQKTLLTSDDNLFVGLVNMAYVVRRLSRYGLPYAD